MNPSLSHNLKRFPFVKLLLPLIFGIAFQWYYPVAMKWWLWQGAIVLGFILFSEKLSLVQKYHLRTYKALLLLYLFFVLGAVLLSSSDSRNHKQWYGNNYKNQPLLVVLSEPLIKKPNSFKAEAKVIAIKMEADWKTAEGNILLYFEKNTDTAGISYGTTALINRPVQPIKNSSNPGAFDYNRYCLFHGITGQVFLKENNYLILPEKQINTLKYALIKIRNSTISILRKYIPGKEEQGIAEALLIGYKNDLDKETVQAYSNTGVVHIIAISGLHLGMIYGLLLLLFSRTSSIKAMRWIQPVIILLVLWLFTLIAGAVPSILRAAVMFSFIVIAKFINRKTQTLNTLAASAFCMLVLDPFVLWDVGFILSYAAVLSIILFYKSINNWFYFKYKLFEKVWQITAVTLSAQVFTIPIVIFYFHQFPNFFLITNLVVVPFSGLILYGEIFLLVIAPFKILAEWLGDFLAILISWMNEFIFFINGIPYSLWKNLQINVFQTWLLIAIIISFVFWIRFNKRKSFIFLLVFINLFIASVSYRFIAINQQQKLIVYDVPHYSAIDFVQGDHYFFIGDAVLKNDSSLRNFHLQPARILFGYNNDSKQQPLLNTIFYFNDWKCIIIDEPIHFEPIQEKIAIDILIISKNAAIGIAALSKWFSFKQLVIDSSIPAWKTEKLKKECEMLHLPFYSVSMQGAFVLNYPAK